MPSSCSARPNRMWRLARRCPGKRFLDGCPMNNCPRCLLTSKCNSLVAISPNAFPESGSCWSCANLFITVICVPLPVPLFRCQINGNNFRSIVRRFLTSSRNAFHWLWIKTFDCIFDSRLLHSKCFDGPFRQTTLWLSAHPQPAISANVLYISINCVPNHFSLLLCVPLLDRLSASVKFNWTC